MSKGKRNMRLMIACLTIGVVTLGVAWIGAQQITPLRAPTGADSDPSWTQVRVHLGAIASAPHPSGSQANARVRDYILATLTAAGYAPELDVHTLTAQEATELVTARLGGIAPRFNAPVTVENIVAELLPENYDPARHATMMAVVHYDAAPGAPGAGDDGAALAGYLEAAAALTNIPPAQRRNRVILLITDGEELGLLGATRYVAAHPEIVHQTAMVVNFELRGNAGAPVMFETGEPAAGPLALLRRLPKPVAFSFATDVYRKMPNYTDFSPFLWAGKSGLNFAAIGGAQHYHQSTDDIGHLSLDTLYAYAELTRTALSALATADVSAFSGASPMYFTFLPGNLIVLPMWAGGVLAWGALALLLVLCITMLHARRMRITGLLLALPMCLAALAAAVGLAYAAAKLGEALLSPTAMMGGTGATVLLLAALMLSAVLLLFCTVWALKAVHPAEWTAMLALLCAVGACALTLFLPGGSYLLSLPALLLLICAAVQCAPARWLTCPLTALPCAAGLGLLMTPVVCLLFQAMGVGALPLCVGVASVGMLAVCAGFAPMLWHEKKAAFASANAAL